MLEAIENNYDLANVILLSIIAIAIVIEVIVEIISLSGKIRRLKSKKNESDKKEPVELCPESYSDDESKKDDSKDDFIQEVKQSKNNVEEIKVKIKQIANEIIKALDDYDNDRYYIQLESHMLRIVDNLIDEDNICECYRICAYEMNACSLVGNDKNSYVFYAFLNKMESYLLSLCDDFEPKHYDNFDYIEHTPDSVSEKRTGKVRYTIKNGKKYKEEVIVKAIVCLDE
ncbi:MAG: hypothetical protein NC310_01145 [Roseburia sp.]|nr:hypothetical protein [Anaeroplasma bactoclasticum]MCM1195659.1 hypothetical protein [Roseburia sp.]MCM1556116.1 hypothetical protein [Anaeroplasma bactoclasticum]